MESDQVKDKNSRIVFNNYFEIQDILMAPLKPLIHLVGFQNSHQVIIQIISEGLAQNPNHHFKSAMVQSYEFYDPKNSQKEAIFSLPAKSDRYKTQELGYLKVSFFKNLILYKPAVFILVFDWQNEDAQTYEWKNIEAEIIHMVKLHLDNCTGARQAKVVLLIFLPLNDSSTVDDKVTSLKKAIAQSGHSQIHTFFLLTNGFEGLKFIQKKITKVLNDLCHTYYREKKFQVKRKQKKLIKEQIENIRYTFKHGIFSSYTKTNYMAAIKYLKDSYGQLKASLGVSTSRTSFDEKRDNADIMMIKILQLFLQNQNPQGFMESYRGHFYVYQNKYTQLKREQKFDELKWRGNWFKLMGKFLEMYPNIVPQTDDKIEFFNGYYYQQCMLQQITRKEDIRRLMRDKGSLYAQAEMEGLTYKQSDLIGKDLIIQDTRDPLGGSNKSSSEFRILYERFKLFQETQINLDPIIQEFGQKAIQAYKTKARLIKGVSSLMYTRSIDFISFHISEYVFAQADKPLTLKAQKYRSQIAKSLISEGWTSEALSLIERSKETVADSIEETFQYEMEILNYAKTLNEREVQRRFFELYQKILLEPITEKTKHPLMSGFIIGDSLLYTRASFRFNKIQVNNYNKLDIEIYSKVAEPINIHKIKVKLNDTTLNHEIVQPYQLSKSSPITLEIDVYLTHETAAQREFILFNELELFMGPKPDPDAEEKKYSFSLALQPYFKPQEDLLQGSDTSKTQFKAKEPIQFFIEPMPTKVNFNLNFDENVDQALLGDDYEVYIQIEPLSVELQSLKMRVLSIDSEPLVNEDQFIDQGVNLMESPKSKSSTILSKSYINQRAIQIDRWGGKTPHKAIMQSESETLFLGAGLSLKQGNQIKQTELFYQVMEAVEDNDFDQNDLKQIDYENSQLEIEIPLKAQKIRLVMRFYQELKSQFSFQFNYSFIQNADTQRKELKQSEKKSFRVVSMSPFKLEWEVKSSDPYLQSLKLRNEQLQLSPMIAPLNEECWVSCSMYSQSASKLLYLKSVDLQIAETQLIKKISQIAIDDGIDGENIVLEPGECYTCVFKIKSNIMELQTAFNDQDYSENPLEVDQFSDLQFQWAPITSKDDSPLVLNSARNSGIDFKHLNYISCSIPSPQIMFFNSPIKIREVNENQFQTVQLNNPINIQYEIQNVSEQVIECQLNIEETEQFFIGGELKSLINLMPYEKYELRYNLIPLQIGRVTFPKLNIVEKEKNQPLVKGFTRKCLVVK